ncbi:urease accessory protein UreF [Streptomyces sp. NPDC048527]|uniref:urease accessory protein UreF n=1 Tax=Streptomyces sp. NPDC048527 TaxID=3365568 RepID=UPI0037207166
MTTPAGPAEPRTTPAEPCTTAARTARNSLSALLLLADGRFPAGAHAHSGGLEAAVALEGVHDLAGLEAFLSGRSATVGHVAAAFAAAACAALRPGGPPWAQGGPSAGPLRTLDDELEARTPSPALRTASRRLGRQLLRCARLVWPDSTLDELAAVVPCGPHQPVVLGAVCAAAGLDPQAAAWAAAHDAVVGPATAAIRLLGLDPFAVYALLARMGGQIDSAAAAGAAQVDVPPADLPARGTPLLDVSTERHATWEVRLFAS